MKIIAAGYMLYIAGLMAYSLSSVEGPFSTKLFILITTAGIFVAGWIMGERS